MRKYKGKQKLFLGFCIMIFAITVNLAMTSMDVRAEENVVRVGFFDLPGFNEYDQDGLPTGYNIEYLNKVAEHTGWKYDFVRANSWPEAYKLLEEHKIDILAPGRKTPEREELFAFSKSPFGEEYGSVLTLDTNYDLAYEDFSQFARIRFGCVDTLVVKEDFLQYARDNGFVPNMTYYKDTNALMSALRVGEVDAVVANLMNAKNNMKVLAKFSPGSFYYMLNKDNEELLIELNEAMSHIKTVHNSLESYLVDKYFKFYNSVAFTKEELNYIESAPVFRVGYISDWQPVSYMDPKTGEAKGITRDIVDRIAQITGLKFEFVPLPTGSINYKYLQENHIDLVSGIEHNSVNLSVSEINLSNPYLNTQKIFVGKDPKIDLKGNIKIALSTGSQTLKEVISARYPEAEIVLYGTIGDSFDAVVSGRADVLIQNRYAVERYLPKPRYEKLVVIPADYIEDELALGAIVDPGSEKAEDLVLADKTLTKIINKAIESINDNEISDIIIRHTVNDPYKLTVMDFYDRYKYFLFVLSGCLAVVVIIIVHSFKLKARNLELVKLSETKLRNITNNINGGVVVLRPDKGLEILFANEGFLSLIQYGKEEYETLRRSNYIAYVHPDDIEILNHVVMNEQEGEQLSIRLRLLRKDGNYLPTLFNGTLSSSGTGQKELYCVIMDISDQLKMMDELEQEQARFNFLLEKSNDMIFDVNLDTNEITITENFRQEFGWTLPGKLEEITAERMSAALCVYEEDMDIVKESLNQVLNMYEDSECRVRIRKKDLTYKWCCVSHHIMMKGLKGVRIIGKVTDIHEEMKEKEKLLRQTQTDTLTGLYNKETFHTLGAKYFKEKEGRNSAVIFLDIDGFKQVNDLLGHMTGDQAIRNVAKKLQVIFSQYDLISRFGGDEFCLLVKEIPFDTLCDKLAWTVEKMKDEYKNDRHSVTVTVSAGVAYSAEDQNDLDQMMLNADKALYSAKEKGKNQFVVYTDELVLNSYQENFGKN